MIKIRTRDEENGHYDIWWDDARKFRIRGERGAFWVSGEHGETTPDNSTFTSLSAAMSFCLSRRIPLIGDTLIGHAPKAPAPVENPYKWYLEEMEKQIKLWKSRGFKIDEEALSRVKIQWKSTEN